MKSSFNNFLMEHQNIINKAVNRYPAYTNNINTSEDYKAVCEQVLYKIYKEDKFKDKQNKEGCIFMEMCKHLMVLQRSAYSTKKNQPKLSIEYEYSNEESSSNLDYYISTEDVEYNEVENKTIWNIVRELVKDEGVEDYIKYYQAGYKSVRDYCLYENKPYQSTNKRFKKYLKILQENKKLFEDYV